MKYVGLKGEWFTFYGYSITGKDYSFNWPITLNKKHFERTTFGIFKYLGKGANWDYGLIKEDTLYGLINPYEETINAFIIRNNVLIVPCHDFNINKEVLELLDPDYKLGEIDEIEIYDKNKELSSVLLFSIMLISGVLFSGGIVFGFLFKDKIDFVENKLLVNGSERLELIFIKGTVFESLLKTTTRTTYTKTGNLWDSTTNYYYKTTIRFIDESRKKYKIIRYYKLGFYVAEGDSVYCLSGKINNNPFQLPFIITYFPRYDNYISSPKNYYWQISFSVLQYKYVRIFAISFLLILLIVPAIGYMLNQKHLSLLRFYLIDLYKSTDYMYAIFFTTLLFCIISLNISKLVRVFQIKKDITSYINQYYYSKY